MAILSLRPGAFRTRNAGRDAETDQARTETVRNAILMALADARRERDGLKQRMSMYYAQAATMLDASDDYAWREKADEVVIRTAEQGAAAARRRVAALDAQIEKFGALILQLDGNSAEAPGEDAGAGVA